ncbi:MAG: hypothetical protein ABIR30_11005 [Chitinophagaceae bacterium]
MKFLLYAILVFIAYQFIFKLVIPVYLATRKIKKGFREMSEKMNPQPPGHQQGFTPPGSTEKPGSRPKAGEYIDFEEVK